MDIKQTRQQKIVKKQQIFYPKTKRPNEITSQR